MTSRSWLYCLAFYSGVKLILHDDRIIIETKLVSCDYVFSLHQRRRVVRPADLPSSLLTQLDGSTVVVTDRPRLRSTFAFQPFLFLLVHLLPLFSSFISASFAYKFQGSILGAVSSANDCRWSVHFVSFVPGRD